MLEKSKEELNQQKSNCSTSVDIILFLEPINPTENTSEHSWTGSRNLFPTPFVTKTSIAIHSTG